MIELKNDFVQVMINEMGAELWSLKYGDEELLWQGDSRYWKRRSPVLFPIVGKACDDTCTFGNQAYRLSQHGFARDHMFVCEERSAEHVVLLLKWSAETMVHYPYRFVLRVEYRLSHHRLCVRWTVENQGEEDMLYQIGAHPGFNYRHFSESDEVHGAVRCYDFDDKEIVPCMTSYLSDGGRVAFESPVALTDGGALNLTKDTFYRDALIIENCQVRRMVLSDKDGNDYLQVVSDDAEVYGIWSPVGKDAPFVCIEPWMGIADKRDFHGPFDQKDISHRLAPHTQADFAFDIEVL